MSKSSAFSINTPFIFEMQEINYALSLNAKGLFFFISNIIGSICSANSNNSFSSNICITAILSHQ